MTRKCSHCSHDGHNSRTCPDRGGVRLFGVRLTDGSIRKSASMGNLSLLSGTNGGASPADGTDAGGAAGAGYASDDLVQGPSSDCPEKKKGVPWTEEEHRMFLVGLQKLGKGDWRGISKIYVLSRTPTQVASHAQKYYIRQSNASRRKRRSSLFDMSPDEPFGLPPIPVNQESDVQAITQHPGKLQQGFADAEFELMDLNPSVDEEIPSNPDTSGHSYPIVLTAFLTPVIQFPQPMWPIQDEPVTGLSTHEILKPRAVHLKRPINVEEFLGMSKLTIGEPGPEAVSTSLSLSLLGSQSRQSAFHASPTAGAQA